MMVPLVYFIQFLVPYVSYFKECEITVTLKKLFCFVKDEKYFLKVIYLYGVFPTQLFKIS